MTARQCAFDPPVLRVNQGDTVRLRVTSLDHDRCHHMPTAFEPEPEPEKFSADGYHPSPESYRVWGEELAEIVVELERSGRALSPAVSAAARRR